MSESILPIVAKRRLTAGLKNFCSFYHIAAIKPGWKEIVTEQKLLLDKLDINPICGFLGSDDDYDFVKNLNLDVQYKSNNLKEYETPTLEMVHRWCLQNKDGAVLYLHTKGASDPKSENKKYWRWLMMDYVVKEYKENLKILEIADMVGLNWQDSPHHPHFSGNFWMARSDWISILDKPSKHRNNGGPTIANHPWERMHAEMWLGSRGYHIIESLCIRNVNYTKMSQIYNQKRKKNG